MYTIDLRNLSKVGPVPFIRQSVVRKQKIPFSTLTEQRRIVARLEAIEEQVQALKKAQEDTEGHLKKLEDSILNKAFLGEL